jgi:hypothetical protein
VQAQRLAVGESRDLIADHAPAHGTGEVGAVERSAELACEDVLATKRLGVVEPRS